MDSPSTGVTNVSERAQVSSSPHQRFFMWADVSNPQDVDGLTHKIVETYGRLDCAF
jgi:hypothetical protein